MKTAEIAAVLQHESSPANANRAVTVLGFLGIPCRVFKTVSELLAELAKASGPTFGVIAPPPAIQDLLAAGSLNSIHSVFTYVTPDSTRSLGLNLARIRDKTEVTVSSSWPEFTGPMHGIRVSVPVDRVLQPDKSPSNRSIIETKDGFIFLELQANGLRIFVSSNEEMVDIDHPLKRPWYDVKDHFLSAVPLLMYLKWAFRDVCWKPSESGACLIIDDPILKLKYGFCDFRELDDQMRAHDFATSIAVIPWNWRRTSRAMAELIRDSGGRLSVSVHGCDHTGAEFGSKAVFLLDSRAALAKARMERHQARTGIPHDLIMVFPQGVFSRESLSALQRHEFLAAVNTEVFPSNPTPEPLTISDMWSPTLTRFGSFPFFVRQVAHFERP